ncbi:hypothetical protein A2U01_0051403, partial [Trifolium medium]|nr:hypothetical protein [Trifolium medium]
MASGVVSVVEDFLDGGLSFSGEGEASGDVAVVWSSEQREVNT